VTVGSSPAWKTVADIVFTRDDGLWEVDAEGVLPPRPFFLHEAKPRDPARALDGRVAFTLGTPGDVYTVKVDGSGLRRLTSDPADDSHPAWTSDGRTIVFASERDGTRHLWAMDADGTDERRVTDSAAAEDLPDVARPIPPAGASGYALVSADARVYVSGDACPANVRLPVADAVVGAPPGESRAMGGHSGGRRRRGRHADVRRSRAAGHQRPDRRDGGDAIGWWVLVGGVGRGCAQLR
jgi:hypothetical protein